MTARRMECSCCGSDAGRWQQWWNRDTGYGVCKRCVTWITTRRPQTEENENMPENIKANYGIEGVHWGEINEVQS